MFAKDHTSYLVKIAIHSFIHYNTWFHALIGWYLLIRSLHPWPWKWTHYQRGHRDRGCKHHTCTLSHLSLVFALLLKNLEMIGLANDCV